MCMWSEMKSRKMDCLIKAKQIFGCLGMHWCLCSGSLASGALCSFLHHTLQPSFCSFKPLSSFYSTDYNYFIAVHVVGWLTNVNLHSAIVYLLICAWLRFALISQLHGLQKIGICILKPLVSSGQVHLVRVLSQLVTWTLSKFCCCRRATI